MGNSQPKLDLASLFLIVYSLKLVASPTMLWDESEIKIQRETETAETLKTRLFNVMLVFSGSLGLPVSLSERNEKQKLRNGAWRWRKAIVLMHKSYHLRSKHCGHQPRGEKLELENQKWQTGSRPWSLSRVRTRCCSLNFQKHKHKHLVSSGLKQEVEFSVPGGHSLVSSTCSRTRSSRAVTIKHAWSYQAVASETAES